MKKTKIKGVGSLAVCIAGIWFLAAHMLPFITNSFESTRSLAQYIDESGIETGQFYYTGVESTASAEAGARGSIDFWKKRRAIEEEKFK